MLRNEKYMGDALLQKAYTVDFLTKKKVKNLGELPQYYVENNHEPIISREIFRQVQRINTQLSSLKSYKLHLSEKTAALGYEERQLTNMLNFIEAHERDGIYVPEIFFHEDEMMLLLDQVRVLDYGYIISFKVGRVIEVAGR